MGTKKIYVDDHNRELSAHGTETFPVTVNHDDLWMFEGRNVPIHWHNEIEFCLPRKGTAVCQIYQESYTIPAGSAILIGSNVPHSCHSLTGESVLYSSIIAAPPAAPIPMNSVQNSSARRARSNLDFVMPCPFL